MSVSPRHPEGAELGAVEYVRCAGRGVPISLGTTTYDRLGVMPTADYYLCHVSFKVTLGQEQTLNITLGIDI